MAKVAGTEGMSPQEIVFELQRGGKFVQYQWCVSVIILTFKRGSDIYFVRAGQSRPIKGLAWTLLSLVAGWWGIPFGPIFTVQSLWINLRGGHDMTPQAINALRLPIDATTLYPEKGFAMAAAAGR